MLTYLQVYCSDLSLRKQTREGQDGRRPSLTEPNIPKASLRKGPRPIGRETSVGSTQGNAFINVTVVGACAERSSSRTQPLRCNFSLVVTFEQTAQVLWT
jgi:hypothetical protein